ncbi:hypothetical protein [Sediminibacillus halophilus]|uniref:Uncharacterized protein n=1 Tax=Sediminibacillus halophilus TaxID=482461 RepID=A0A1G9T768_9BACI|nr:hypothetical protein [Sediminibacillus halophilus]SDM43460.1 hypothetical protein SAMN05216244_2460 [Sediminibacillus halophilus]
MEFFGGFSLVIAYLILLILPDHWIGLLTSFLFCISGVLILKEKGERWFENKWFKGYICVLFFLLLINVSGFLTDMKEDWFVPSDAVYVRQFHNQYIEMFYLFLPFITLIVFVRCYFSSKKYWFKRWHFTIWALLLFIGCNIALLNHYQYVDETAIHSKGLFSSTTLSLDEIERMDINPKIKTLYNRGGSEKSFNFDLYFVSQEGRDITFGNMFLNEKDIHGVVMLLDKLENSNREIETVVNRPMFMSYEMSSILEQRLNSLDEEVANLFRENVLVSY